MYRVYCDGREFGIDYLTLDAAQAAKQAYAVYWPHLNYVVCKTGRPT